MTPMKSVKLLTILFISGLLAYGCGSSQAAGDKLAELEAKKAQLAELQDEIETLESELIESGELTVQVNKVLVSAIKVEPQSFTHKVEVRGGIESKKNVTLMAESMGRIVDIKISEGDRVNKGQSLVQLDASVLRNNIAEVETGLELAIEVYQRQERLWEQNIGTEIQYLQAKNNKESLESKLATLKSQLRLYTITAPFSGVVDLIPVKEGEMAQPGLPVVRMVNPKSMYISAEVSESFLGKFNVGDVVEIYIPSLDKDMKSSISAVGQVINPENRTFKLDIDLPTSSGELKANQVVVLTLVDYENETAYTLPTKLIQSDSRGQYVYQIVNTDGITMATKARVKAGVSYNNETEIVDGLEMGQMIAFQGYRELSEGAIVDLVEN